MRRLGKYFSFGDVCGTAGAVISLAVGPTGDGSGWFFAVCAAFWAGACVFQWREIPEWRSGVVGVALAAVMCSAAAIQEFAP